MKVLPTCGPLNNADQVMRYDASSAGSSAGKRFVSEVAVDAEELEGYWRPACVLADLPDDDPAVMEEVLGPVLTVQAAGSVPDIIRLAHNVPEALAASVWSSDVGNTPAIAGARSTAVRLGSTVTWSRRLSSHMADAVALVMGLI